MKVFVLMTSTNYGAVRRKYYFDVSSVAGEMAQFPVVAHFPVTYVSGLTYPPYH